MTFPSTITVEVTTDDIERGIKDHCSECPIGRAIQRQFPNHWIDARETGVNLEDYDGNGVNYNTPEAAQSFMHAFDHGQHVEPATFVFVKGEPY